MNHVTFAPYCVAMKERGTSECGPTERFTLRSIPCWGDRCNPIGICEKESRRDKVIFSSLIILIKNAGIGRARSLVMAVSI